MCEPEITATDGKVPLRNAFGGAHRLHLADIQGSGHHTSACSFCRSRVAALVAC